MGEPVEERFPGLEPISFELKHNQPPEGVERYESWFLSSYEQLSKMMKSYEAETAQMLC